MFGVWTRKTAVFSTIYDLRFLVRQSSLEFRHVTIWKRVQTQLYTTIEQIIYSCNIIVIIKAVQCVCERLMIAHFIFICRYYKHLHAFIRQTSGIKISWPWANEYVFSYTYNIRTNYPYNLFYTFISQIHRSTRKLFAGVTQ